MPNGRQGTEAGGAIADHTVSSKPHTTEPSSQPPATKPSSPVNDPTIREDIYTVPNILTFTRLVAAPFVGYFVLNDSHALAFGLFAYAGVTDALDGWIARKWNSKTVVGTVIDPMADKALMTILTVCLAVKGLLPGTYHGIHGDTSFERGGVELTRRNSLGRSHHSRTRCRSRHRGDLLPLDLSPAAQDLRALLGLLAAVG